MKILQKEELIKKVSDPKVLPMVAKKVLDIVGNDQASISEICETVQKDQTISANILKIANSAYYGLRKEVRSVRQAILMLGLSAIRDIALTVSTKLQHKRFGIVEQLMWDHSVGAAIAARHIAAGRGKELEEIAFFGGLFHDFGKVVINNECPEAFSGVMQRIYNDHEDPLTAERGIFDYAHTEIGALVMEKWKFPAIFVSILENHHLENRSVEAFPDTFNAQVIACINLANNMCIRLGIGYRAADQNLLLHDLPSAQFLGISKEGVERLISDVQTAYQAEKSAFSNTQ
jgi:putative nucleotidyltransferase with HDIG domain